MLSRWGSSIYLVDALGGWRGYELTNKALFAIEIMG